MYCLIWIWNLFLPPMYCPLSFSSKDLSLLLPGRRLLPRFPFLLRHLLYQSLLPLFVPINRHRYMPWSLTVMGSYWSPSICIVRPTIKPSSTLMSGALLPLLLHSSGLLNSMMSCRTALAVESRRWDGLCLCFFLQVLLIGLRKWDVW